MSGDFQTGMSMFARQIITCVCLIATGVAGAHGAAQIRAAEPVRHVYVPVDDLDTILDRDSGGVLLQRAEYDELERAARSGAAGQPDLPVGAVLSQADYAARINGDQLLMSVTASVTGFRQGWSRLVLPAGGVGVESATIDGAPARLARDPEQPTALVLYIAEPGPHALALELSTPLTAVSGDRAAAFELINAPTGSLTLTLPAGKHLTVNNAQPERPAAIDAEAAYIVPVGGQKSIRLRITDRAAAATGDALTFAQSAIGIYVAPGEITWTARTSLQVYGRAIDTLVCTVPRSLELTGVESSGLESWELATPDDTPDQTIITLRYRQAWDGTRDITFRGIVAAPADTAWNVPALTIREITSHVGRAIVRFPPGIRLQMVDSVGIRPVLAVNGMDPANPSLEYEIWRENFRLSFLTAAKEREIHAAMTTLVDVNASGLDLSVTLDARTLFAPLFELQLRIPAEWTVRSAAIAGAPVEWQVVPQEAGINQVQIPLNPPLTVNETRQFTLHAHYDPEGWPVEQAPITFKLPEVRLPQVGVIEALYGIVADDDLEIRPLDVAGLDPARKDDLDLLNGKLQAVGRSVRLGYTFQDTVFSGQLEVSRRPSRVAVSTVLFFRADRQSLSGHLESVIDVAGGGIRELQAAVSESAGTDLRFRLLQSIGDHRGREVFATHDARIVEQIPGEPANGLRPWTLRFDQRIRGRMVLLVDVQTPLPTPPADAAANSTATFTPFVLTIPGAERETGHIAVESSGEQHVQVTTTDPAGAPLPTVDPVDFPPALYRPAERVVAGFSYARPGWTMTISRNEYERQPVPTAMVHSAQLESVLSETGEMQHQADYSFTAIGIQSLRLQLATNDDGTPAELWGVLIDGEPVEVRDSESGQLIALPPTDTPLEPRSLRLSYRTLVAPLDQASGRLQQSPPVLAAVTGAGAEQPLEILDQKWIVHHSKGTLFIDSSGRFHPGQELDRDSFLGRIEQLLRAPSPQDLLRAGVAIAAAIVAAWLISLGLAQARTIGSALVVVAVIALLAVLSLVTVTSSLRKVKVPDAERMSASYMRDDIQYAPKPVSSKQFAPASADDEARVQLGTSATEAVPQLAEAAEPPAAMNPFAASDAPSQEQSGESIERPMSNDDFTPLAPFGAVDPIHSNELRGVEGNANNRVDESPLTPDTTVGMPLGRRHSPGLNIPFRQGSFELGVPEFSGVQAQTSGQALPQQTDADSDQLLDLSLRQTQTALGRGGLLSLTLDLEPPPGYVSRDFVYRGDVTSDGGGDLNLTYASKRAGRALTFVIAAAAILVCWMFRRYPVTERLWLAAILFVVPLALMTVAPVIWLPILDGLLLGGLAGFALWGIVALYNCSIHETGPFSREDLHSAASILLFVGAALLSGSTVSAQQPANGPAQPPVVQTAEEAARAALDAIEQSVIAKPEPTFRPPTGIIIPYDAGTDPLASQRVFLSHDQFLELWNRAHPEQQLPATAPVDGIVSEALYAARLEGEGDAARIVVNARFVVHNFRTQQIILVLPLMAVSLVSSTLDGAPAAVSVTGECFTVVLPSTGAHVLDLVFTVPARLAGPAGEFKLPLLAVPAGKLSFALPTADDLIVSLAGGASTYRLREQDGVKFVETSVDHGGDVTVSWRPKTMRGDSGTVVHVDATTALLAGDAGLTYSHALVYRVRQGSVSEIAFRAPLGLSLKRIAGPDVGGWELADQGDNRQFRIFLKRAVDDETSLILEFHQPLAVTDQPQSLAVPELTLENVTRETGVVGLYAPEHFVVRATAAGASQINAGTFSAPLLAGLPAEAPRLAFRYASRPLGLELNVSRRLPETRATAEHGVQVELRKAHIASRIRFELTGAPRLALSFQLPAGYLPLDVQARFLADWYISGPDDARVLTIELDQPRTGAVEVVLEGHVQRQPDDATATIDVPQPLSVNRLTSQLAIWLDASYTASLDALGQWKSVDPASLANALRGLRPLAPQFAFQSSAADPETASLTLTRATPQLSADAIALVAVSETSVDYGFTLRWKIRQAAADAFVVVTPAWLKGRLEFTGDGVREVTSSDLDGGRVRWTINLIDPVETEYLLTAVATLPPPADLQVALPDLSFEQPGNGGTSAPLATQAQYAVLVNLSGWQMSPVDQALVDSIARDDLPFELRDELLNQAMEIVRIKSGSAPAWKLERLAQVASAEATVTAAEMRTVLDYDGSWRMKAVYTVRNRGRQFLALNLPADARVLSVFVRGTPSRTVLTTLDNQPVHLIALPQTSISDLSFNVEIVLAGRLPAPLPEGFNLSSREIELPAPTVVTREQAIAGGQPDLGAPVIHTQWTVQLPDGIDATIVSDTSRSNVTPEQGSWLLQLSRDEADVADMVKVLEDPFSSQRNRFQAANNLKKKGLELQKSRQWSAPSSGPDTKADGPTDEYFSRNSALQEQAAEKVREFEASNGIVNGNGEYDALFGQSGKDVGRNFILGNNTMIATDNRDAGVAAQQSAPRDAETFNFDLSETDAKASNEPVQSGKKADASRGKLREQLKEQSVDDFQSKGRSDLQSHTLRNRAWQAQPAPAAAGARPESVFWETTNDVELSLQHNFRDGAPSDMFENGQRSAGERFDGLALGAAESEVSGGGMGGGDFGDRAAGPAAAWSSAGGLSLPIAIPRAEQELRFAKIGGEPRLTLAVRPRQTLTLALGAIWTLVCLFGGLWLVRTAARHEARDALQYAPTALIAVGLLGFLLTPSPVNWTFFAAFALGALLFAIQRRRSTLADDE